MAQPVLHVYLGSVFNPDTADIFDEPSSWTEITPAVREAQWQRGRQRELDEIQVGTGSLLLRNATRAFDPTNTDGPYFPLDDRQVKIEAVLGATTYSLFRGWTVNWHVSWNAEWEPPSGGYSETQVELVDAIALFQAWPVSVAPGNDTISARIGEVLTSIGFPAGMRALSGGSTVQPAVGSVRVWEHLQTCAASDTGLRVCFIDGRGYVVFGSVTDSGVTFGDGGGAELPYAAAGLNYGTDLVYSHVTVTREGGTPQTKSLFGSAGGQAHGLRSYERSTLNISDADAFQVATEIFSAYLAPSPRPEPVTVRPGSNTALWTQVLDLDLEQMVTFTRRPPGGGDPFSQKMTIVGLEHHAVPAMADWTTRYRLVGQTLGFPAVGVVDSFNGANFGPPMPSWSAWNNVGLKRLSNQCAPNGTGANDAYWNFAMPFPNVEAYITIATLPATGGYTYVFARLDPAAFNGYAVQHLVSAGTDSITLWRFTGGSGTNLGSWSLNLAAGDKIGIRCRGSIIEAWAAVSGLWQLLGAVTNTTYAGTGSNNKLALYNNGNGTSVARYDNFGGTIWRPTPP